MDFGLKHRLGNLLDKSYDEILASKEWKKIAGNRYSRDGSTICRDCSFAKPSLRYAAGFYAGNFSKLFGRGVGESSSEIHFLNKPSYPSTK